MEYPSREYPSRNLPWNIPLGESSREYLSLHGIYNIILVHSTTWDEPKWAQYKPKCTKIERFVTLACVSSTCTYFIATNAFDQRATLYRTCRQRSPAFSEWNLGLRLAPSREGPWWSFALWARPSQLMDSSEREREKKTCFVVRPTKYVFAFFSLSLWLWCTTHNTKDHHLVLHVKEPTPVLKFEPLWWSLTLCVIYHSWWTTRSGEEFLWVPPQNTFS